MTESDVPSFHIEASRSIVKAPEVFSTLPLALSVSATFGAHAVSVR
jgi:hypothetical protein